MGIPLPLCSCSVLPVAHQLRKSGLNKGATASFLISTPETGVDSILLTYSLTDPVLTVARPVAAFLTAMTAGVLINQFDNDEAVIVEEEENSCGACCSTTDNKSNSVFSKIIDVCMYATQTILKDLAPYLLIGYLLAGLITIVIGDSFESIPEILRSGWGAYLGAVLVGLPLYICATSSTPLAAALLAVGFSPGAILVFLLVGPATNIASLTVILKLLMKKALIIYLSTLIIISIICGIAVDFIYDSFELSTLYTIGRHHDVYNLISHISAIFLIVFVLYYSLLILKNRIAKF